MRRETCLFSARCLLELAFPSLLFSSSASTGQLVSVSYHFCLVRESLVDKKGIKNIKLLV